MTVSINLTVPEKDNYFKGDGYTFRGSNSFKIDMFPFWKGVRS